VGIDAILTTKDIDANVFKLTMLTGRFFGLVMMCSVCFAQLTVPKPTLYATVMKSRCTCISPLRISCRREATYILPFTIINHQPKLWADGCSCALCIVACPVSMQACHPSCNRTYVRTGREKRARQGTLLLVCAFPAQMSHSGLCCLFALGKYAYAGWSFVCMHKHCGNLTWLGQSTSISAAVEGYPKLDGHRFQLESLKA
jgi:hypothetical protein